MPSDVPSQAEMEQLISDKLQEKMWTFECAEQILFVIQCYKLCDIDNLDTTTTLEEFDADSSLKESNAFLLEGLRDGHLHDISTKQIGIPKEYVASAAAGIIASTSPMITPALSMISPFAPLALAAAPFLLKKKRKLQHNTKQAALIPSEVMMYAKRHNKWLDGSQLSTNISASESPQLHTTQHINGNLPTVESAEYNEAYKEALRKKILTEAGSKKGKKADEVKKDITAKVIEILDAGCRCHNTELARFLLKNNINKDKTKIYVLKGIKKDCYETHFLKATNAGFKIRNIPLRNEPKAEGEPRGKRYCDRPGHAD